MPPSASQEAWSEIVPPTACASSDNPINPKIKILAMIGIAQIALMLKLLHERYT